MAVALGDRFGRRTVFIDRHRDLHARLGRSRRSAPTRPSSSWRAPCRASAARPSCRSRSPCSPASVAPERRPLAIGIWGGIAGPRRRRRSAHRRRRARGLELAGDLLDQRARRPHRHPAGPRRCCPTASAPELRADVVGLVLAGLGVLGVVLRHRARQRRGLGQLRGGRLAHRAAAALLVAFLLWERRTPAPLLPLRLFRDRSFSIANVVGLRVQLRHLRGGLHPDPVPADRAGSHARSRPPCMTTPWTLAPMVVAPTRRLHRAAGRHPRAHRRRPRAAGRRAHLARA